MLPILKYLENISRIRNTATVCSDNNEINESMLQSIKQAEYEQCTK
jgi:hypothetical protein